MLAAIKQRSSAAAGFLSQGLRSAHSVFKGDPLGQLGIIVLSCFVLLGIFAPKLAPRDPYVTHRGPDGSVLRVVGPSLDHPLGTTQYGYDLLSQLILGTRVSLIVGVTAAFIAVFIGTNIGLISAYYGGVVDSALMRVTDIAYGLPFLPFALIFVIVIGQSITSITLAIAFIMWRSTARVVRSQVLSHKERAYVESAEAAGASNLRIMYIHILPNVLPLAFLYTAFSVAWAIIIEASISFLGFGDTEMISWGRMIFQAQNADVIHFAWWWVFPPGLAIIMVVMSVFFISRSLEKLVHPSLRHKE